MLPSARVMTRCGPDRVPAADAAAADRDAAAVEAHRHDRAGLGVGVEADARRAEIGAVAGEPAGEPDIAAEHFLHAGDELGAVDGGAVREDEHAAQSLALEPPREIDADLERILAVAGALLGCAQPGRGELDRGGDDRAVMDAVADDLAAGGAAEQCRAGIGRAQLGKARAIIERAGRCEIEDERGFQPHFLVEDAPVAPGLPDTLLDSHATSPRTKKRRGQSGGFCLKRSETNQPATSAENR